jgi:Spy/CpxP family protein refolding chaperone
MKRTIIFLTVAIMLAGVAAYAQYHPSRAPRADCFGQGMRHGDFIKPGMLLRLADKIGLDEKQKAQIDKLAQERGLARIDKQAELEKAQLKLRHMKLNDAPEADVLKMMDNIGQLKTELHKSAYKFRQTVKSILTEDQLDKIKELRMEHHRGNFPGRPGYGPGQGKGHGYGSKFVPNPDGHPYGGKRW